MTITPTAAASSANVTLNHRRELQKASPETHAKYFCVDWSVGNGWTRGDFCLTEEGQSVAAEILGGGYRSEYHKMEAVAQHAIQSLQGLPPTRLQ